jgi:hypothetical protein
MRTRPYILLHKSSPSNPFLNHQKQQQQQASSLRQFAAPFQE